MGFTGIDEILLIPGAHSHLTLKCKQIVDRSNILHSLLLALPVFIIHVKVI